MSPYCFGACRRARRKQLYYKKYDEKLMNATVDMIVGMLSVTVYMLAFLCITAVTTSICRIVLYTIL